MTDQHVTAVTTITRTDWFPSEMTMQEVLDAIEAGTFVAHNEVKQEDVAIYHLGKVLYSDFEALLKACQEAADAAYGDSNDGEIAALQNALGLALGHLGLEMPEGKEEA